MKEWRVPFRVLEDPTMRIPEALEKAIKEAVEAERERCAKVAESVRDGWAKHNDPAWNAADDIAELIRKGGM